MLPEHITTWGHGLDRSLKEWCHKREKMRHCPQQSALGGGWIRCSVVEETQYFVARCLQLLFLLGRVKLSSAILCLPLLLHLDSFSTAIQPSQSRKMTSSACLLPDHSAFSWTLKRWSRCWKLYSPLGLIHGVPAFSRGMGRGGELGFVTEITGWLIFAVLQTWV